VPVSLWACIEPLTPVRRGFAVKNLERAWPRLLLLRARLGPFVGQLCLGEVGPDAAGEAKSVEPSPRASTYSMPRWHGAERSRHLCVVPPVETDRPIWQA
jgi:hypothetical protein